nr:ABC transporter ATP-binding protein [Roseomonas acroporae]
MHGVSFSLAAGRIATLLGGNGAGKSTLLRAVYGANRHYGGAVLFEGRDITALSPPRRLALGIGFVPQGRCNFAAMTVAENLLMGGYTLKRTEREAAIAAMLERFPVLARKAGEAAGNLSGGEQQVLEMAMVLITGPRLLLLDEPSLGLSPRMQAEVFATVAGLARESGVAVLMVEQNLRGALAISDTAIVLEMGRKFLEGPAAEVAVDPRIRHAYLGGNVTAADAA